MLASLRLSSKLLHQIDDLQNKCCNLNAKRQSQNPCCSPVVLAAGLFVVVHSVLSSFSLISSLTAASIFSRMPRGLRLLFRIREQ
nr:MAG TPA: hypothetical protein [Caudoviricetes sp.]